MQRDFEEPPIDAVFLESIKRKLDIELIGVADIREERKNFLGLPHRFVEQMPLAIVIAKRVSATVLGTLEDGPNLIYYHHYRQLNFMLDEAAQRIASEIEEMGHNALPIAASQIVDWERQAGHVSHKRLAWLAGLGWWGRNGLLVTEEWGAQVRLASILTDFPLTPAIPTDKNCGLCQRCLDICPAGAIKENAQDFNLQACFDKLKEFRRTHSVGQYICGLCVKCCTGK